MTYFNGPSDEIDRTKRLTKQHLAIRELMSDGEARTLKQISETVEANGVKCPPASASAQLRHLRKPRFGSYLVEKNHLGHGLYEYKVGKPGEHVVTTKPAAKPAAKPVEDQKYISEKLLKYAYLAGVCREWGKLWAVGYFSYAKIFGKDAAGKATTQELETLGKIVLETGSFIYDEEVDWVYYDESGENRIR